MDTFCASSALRGNCRKNIIIFVDFSVNMRIIGICMDTHKCIKDEYGALLADLTNHKVIVGAKQIRKAINSRHISRVLLAKNADFVLTEALEALCLENHIPYAWVPNMTQLGHACGIDVGTAAAAIVD